MYMYACMYVYMYTHVHTPIIGFNFVAQHRRVLHTRMLTNEYIHICTCIYAYAHMCMCVYTYVYGRVYVYTPVVGFNFVAKRGINGLAYTHADI